MKISYLYLIVLIILPYRSFCQDTVLLKKYFGNLKKVDLSINGQSYSFLFDTGSGETFVTPEVVNHLGKPIYGNTTGFRMTGEVINYQRCDSVFLKINSTTLFHASIGVWDIMKVLPKGFPKLDGVLSLKSFHDKIVTLDLANDRIIFETQISYQKKIRNKTLLNSRFANGLDANQLTILLGIPHLGRFYWFLFDSGNLDNLLLSHLTASEWGLQSDTVIQGNKLGALTVQIGDKHFSSEASSKAIIYDGSLNYSIISKSIFIINFQKRQIWMH